MSRKYKFYDSSKAHFVSFATISWLDVFTRRPYFNVITESLSYCINSKGLVVNAWCIMTNHLHLVIRSDTNKLGAIIRDMKKFTAKKLISCIHSNPQESRKER
ncbi:transposase [Fodinibius salsisoli]|uniref:Transposase n=1 Tax=Fodinibius salsisoli TaxID=2820877 RepID=A0ABT3PQW2_9BACT|nr:transposase [Fodinibius salsisoli]MCW9708262.1 transposase [Fodinibius salsisoli]